ncbi:MAG TPA: cyclase family protein [Acidimicrobiales bacterium]|nr:cyclase family protein [Acidimicrobiales bacterium]
MTGPEGVVAPAYLAWLRELAAAQPPGERRGTLRYIDDAARQRWRDAVRAGRSVDLCRAMAEGVSSRGDGRPAFRLDVFYDDGPIGMGSDHLELDCHGVINTHLDGINHIALDGTFYGGHPAGEPGAPSVADLARGGIVTRAVYVDVPAVRGTGWVDADRPVAGADFDAAMARSGVTFAPGDALLVDMGRDRFEAAGLQTAPDYRPGIGEDGARWIAAHGVSVVCWDFLDAFTASEPRAPVHLLNWAIGLVLVDNCDFSRLRAALGPHGATGALVLAPLPLEGATGCNVSPIVLL